MAEEVGIVMSLYDRVSPTLKAIAGNSQAFDKTLDDLEESIKSYDKAQDSMVKKYADLKKAMAETDNQVKAAQKSYKKLNDEASKKALDEAIDRQTELRRALTETETNLKANSKAYDDLYEQARKAARGIGETEAAARRADNRAGGLAGAAGMISALGKAGLYDMLGDAAGQWAGTLASSALGSSGGSLFSSVLGSAGSGAAIGSMIAPGVGTAVGAAIGAGVGLASGASQIYEGRDSAFQSYVQEAAEGQISERDSAISSGSSVAAQRELDAIAFNKLLGEGVGDQYLKDLRAMAAETPMEYSDLTAMSRALATGFGSDPQRMLDLMEGIGNAGSAVGVSASDMSVMAQALSRMQSSDKASLEYLNMFQERGVDVIGMLAGSLGVSQGEVYDMISKGSISGTQAVSIIQQGLDQYAGAMDEMSRTFSGLSSTLADAETEMDAAYGEGYNAERAKGLQAQTEWLSGVSGEAQQEANKAIGAWQASLENQKEQFQREALDAVMSGAETTLFSEEAQKRLNDLTNEYQKAQVEGDAAEMGRALAEARVMALNEYNASEGAQLALESEKALIAGIRADTGLKSDYWDAGYEMGLEYSKGMAAAWADNHPLGESGRAISSSYQDWVRESNTDTLYTPHAAGLDRVPYDNYAALLHEGERVLTAREAREMDQETSSPIQIIVTGSWSVRTDEDVDAIATAILRKAELAQRGGVR